MISSIRKICAGGNVNAPELKKGSNSFITGSNFFATSYSPNHPKLVSDFPPEYFGDGYDVVTRDWTF